MGSACLASLSPTGFPEPNAKAMPTAAMATSATQPTTTGMSHGFFFVCRYVALPRENEFAAGASRKVGESPASDAERLPPDGCGKGCEGEAGAPLPVVDGFGASGCPQLGQNRLPSGTSTPHLLQNMAPPPVAHPTHFLLHDPLLPQPASSSGLPMRSLTTPVRFAARLPHERSTKRPEIRLRLKYRHRAGRTGCATIAAHRSPRFGHPLVQHAQSSIWFVSRQRDISQTSRTM